MARVFMPPGSDPASGSVRPKHAISPEAIRGADDAVRRITEFAIHNEAFLRDLVAGRTKLGAPSAGRD